MGNQLSGAAPGQILSVDRYLADLPDCHYNASLGSTRFMKVATAFHDEGLVVAKVFVIHDQSLPLQPHKEYIEEVTAALQSSVHCCPFQRVVLSDKCAILIRQYGKDTLYDRLNTRPFLSLIEKRWIAFQLLKALEQCNNVNVCHGDVKSENVLVSSSLWVTLADFASFKPTYLPHDNPADFSYFFDTSRRRSCYLAPERFGSDLAVAASNALVMLPEELCSAHQLTHAMDIFSVGCVLIELFTDGCAPFDFSQMLSYREGKYDPQEHIDKIGCPHTAELVRHMLQRDPKKRWTASQYLAWQRGKAFPEVFYSFVWTYLQQLIVQPLLSYDRRIAKLKSSMSKILSNLTLSSNNSFHPALVIFLGVITSALRNLKFTETKLDSFDLLEQLSKTMNSEIILDRIVPYIVQMLPDPFPRVRAAAIRTLTKCLASVDSLPQSDLQVFSVYVFPKVANLVFDSSSLVRISLAENIADLAATAARFLDFAIENYEADPQVQDAGFDPNNSDFDAALESNSLRENIQEVVVTLLCDQENAIKRQLIQSGLAKLASFFGKARASDVLLSHMITFLNDKSDWQLRAAFYEFVPELAASIGVQSSLILKPLLQQGLRDFQEMVVFRSLACLADLSSRGLLQKPTVYELVNDSVPFLCHPNEWIRIAATAFICCLADKLNIADVHCKLIPLINPYLKQPLIRLGNELQSVMLRNLCSPISRQIYDLIVKGSLVVEICDFLRDKHLARQLSRGGQPANRHVLPDDPLLAQFYQKLLNQGITDDTEDRLLAYHDILVKMVKLKNSCSMDYSPSDPTRPGVIPLSGSMQHGGLRRHADLTVAHSGRHRPDSSASNQAGAKSLPNARNEDWQQMFGAATNHVDTNESIGEDGSLKDLNLNNNDSLTPEQENPETAEEAINHHASVGAAEGQMLDKVAEKEFNAIVGRNRTGDSGMIVVGNTGEMESVCNLISLSADLSDAKLGVLEEAASDSLGHLSECRRSLTELVEFKRTEYKRSSRRNRRPTGDTAKPSATTPFHSWKPQGRLVAHLHEHKSSVNQLTVHPNNCMFASCSSDGTVKIWDSQRMEGKSIANGSRWTHQQGAKCRSVAFCNHGQSVLVASENNIVQLLRIEATSGATITSSLQLNPDVEGFPIVSEVFYDGVGDFAVIGTHHGHVIGWDIRQSKPAWNFENRCENGLVTSMCLDQSNQHWVCLGTDLGRLITWDLRFLLPVNTIEHPASVRARMQRLWSCPNRPSFVFASVYGNGEVSLWDLETGTRHATFWPCDLPALSYLEVQKVVANGLCFLGTPDSSISSMGSVLVGTSNTSIHYWDLHDSRNSQLISMSGQEKIFQYRSLLVEGTQVQQVSELPKTKFAGGKSTGLGSFSGGTNPTVAKQLLEPTPSTAHHDCITDLLLVKPTQPLLVSSARDGVIKVWK